VLLRLKIQILLVCCLVLSACGQVDLISGLTEREANEMMSLLHQRTIEVHKTQESDSLFSIQVSEDDKVAAIAVLANHGLPRESRQTCVQIYQKKGGVIRSRTEEQERLRCGMQMDLEETLSHFEGIITTRVQLVLPVSDPLKQTQEKASASVYLKTRHDIELNDRKNIKKLVTDSVPGLEYPNVTLFIEKSASMLDKSNDMKQIEEIRDANDLQRTSGGNNRLVFGIGGVLLVFATVAALLYRRGRMAQSVENESRMEYEEEQQLASQHDGSVAVAGHISPDRQLGMNDPTQRS